MSTAPDWYTDPINPDQVRWWDGESWTNRVALKAATPQYAETDYRNHGQIKAADYSFFLESSRNRISQQLNANEIKPDLNEKPEQAESSDLLAEDKPGRLAEAKNKLLVWLKSESNLTTKKKILLAVALTISFIITGSILFITYQIDNNFGKPTPYEQINLREGARNSPSIIDSKVTYDESRQCNNLTLCEPYRITVSGSSAFNEHDYISFISTVALLKTSKVNIQVCFSDNDLDSVLQKPAEHYAAIMDTSQLKESRIEVSDGTACTVFTGDYLKQVADEF